MHVTLQLNTPEMMPMRVRIYPISLSKCGHEPGADSIWRQIVVSRCIWLRQHQLGKTAQSFQTVPRHRGRGPGSRVSNIELAERIFLLAKITQRTADNDVFLV